jgi:outer membrane protein assembly factor BamB
MLQKMVFAIALLAFALSSLTGTADDWPRFRGPGGEGVSADASIPATWSPKANLAWKTEMPGPGASSPIIIDGKAFVTCYSGYGLTKDNPGEIENLVRHLVCVDLASGKKLWQKDVKAVMPEDPYAGIGVTAHGYASHTPVSDGKNIYTFFGKGGVHAFDMDGNELWNANAGKESDPTKWGSSSSPIVHNNTVIVTASAESQAIIGYDKSTGEEKWRQEAKGLDGMWGTPSLIKVDDDRTDLVMCVAKELWGLDPETGDMRWFAGATNSRHSYSSLVSDGNRVFAFTGRDGGSVAVDAGGTGDVSETNTVWVGRDNASFASPVRHGSKLYVVARGILTVVDASTGKRVGQQLRLKGAIKVSGQFGSLDYPSPVVVGDRLFYLNGSGQMYVFELGDEVKQVAVNQVTSDKEVFWGSPAISDGRMVLRSAKYLYCVADKGETVQQDETLLAKADDPPEAAQQAGQGGRGAGRGGPGGGGRGGRSGGGRFDPMTMFNQLDADKDGSLTEAELAGNRMADRLKTLDKDDDKAISSEEFRTGITSLFSRGGGGGGGGRGGYGGGDKRPDRPQRPAMAGQDK